MTQQDIVELFDIEPRYWSFVSAASLVFGAAIGAVLGTILIDRGNTLETFVTIICVFAALCTYSMMTLLSGSELAKHGFSGLAAVRAAWSFVWVAILSAVAQWALGSGWISLALLLPWAVYSTYIGWVVHKVVLAG